MRGGAGRGRGSASGLRGRSPRARGSPGPQVIHFPMTGAIPACAGEPFTSRAGDRDSRGDPRVRGGASCSPGASRTCSGRSPRARGSPCLRARGARLPGAIPACAGEPSSLSFWCGAGAGDPRVRGGAGRGRGSVSGPRGRSPRARGSPSWALVGPNTPGAIPACAGEPDGGNDAGLTHGGDPRVRGGARGTVSRWIGGQGRSPRARGSRLRSSARRVRLGAIPACAGEPATPPYGGVASGGDPRVRGGADPGLVLLGPHQGRSPRARGSHPRPGVQADHAGAIPACAGEPSRLPVRWRGKRGDPRVRGGAVAAAGQVARQEGRSPRARGSRGLRPDVREVAGAIPACAGEPPGALGSPSISAGDPRVRGGADSWSVSSLSGGGRSPRARGSRRRSCAAVGAAGAIPACAGEPSAGDSHAGWPRGDPRVRGGAGRGRGSASGPRGRSPRARGSLVCMASSLSLFRAIPACAGEPLSIRYPTACGPSSCTLRAGWT